MTIGWLILSIILLAFVLAGVAALVLWLQRQSDRMARQAEESARKALKDVADELVRCATQEFERARREDAHGIELKKQKIDSAIDGLTKQLGTYEELVRQFEADRDKKFGFLQSELGRAVHQTDQLRNTTASLVAVLGNSRVRGQWGHKMAEDVLRNCGLQERIHYVQEKEMAAGRPDYTFLLPEEHKLFMDVKFPLDNYLKVVQTQNPEEQQRARDQFIRDVREHIRTMERREYADQGGSLDYILLFIPNEQVYGAVNEWIPGLIDECLKKRIILCGPWTLYAIVRIVWQAWQNYHYSLAIQDIVKSINGFLQDFGKFKERFGELGDRLTKASEKYQEIVGTSYRRLDSRLQQIEAYRKGRQISSDEVVSGQPVDNEAIPELTGGPS